MRVRLDACVPRTLVRCAQLDKLDVAHHFIRPKHVYDQHGSANEVADSRTLWRVDDAGVLNACGMQSQHIGILSYQYPAGAGGKANLSLITGAEHGRFMGSQYICASRTQAVDHSPRHMLVNVQSNAKAQAADP